MVQMPDYLKSKLLNETDEDTYEIFTIHKHGLKVYLVLSAKEKYFKITKHLYTNDFEYYCDLCRISIFEPKYIKAENGFYKLLKNECRSLRITLNKRINGIDKYYWKKILKLLNVDAKLKMPNYRKLKITKEYDWYCYEIDGYAKPSKSLKERSADNSIRAFDIEELKLRITTAYSYNKNPLTYFKVYKFFGMVNDFHNCDLCRISMRDPSYIIADNGFYRLTHEEIDAIISLLKDKYDDNTTNWEHLQDLTDDNIDIELGIDDKPDRSYLKRSLPMPDYTKLYR